MKVGKPTSKRVPVRLRHKIEKASAAKQRKQRKAAKKNPEWRSRLKKDPGIPNLFPYKDKILHEIEEAKRRKEEETIRRRDEAKARRQGIVTETVNEPEPIIEDEDEDLLDYDVDEDEGQAMEEDNGVNPMAALLASAKAQAAKYDKHDPSSIDHDSDASDWPGLEDDQPTTASNHRNDTSRRAYDKHFKQVISSSDIILYVLDARDPEGTRSREVEREVSALPSKRLVLILNKIDLVPPTVLKNWLLHLRRSFPTLPLRASTATSNANTFDHKQLTLQRTSATLLKALKTYAATSASGAKTTRGRTTIGVLGYPNVGKSSVVAALAAQLGRPNRSLAPTGAEAGLTTSVREVKLDASLRLLDSPGIVFPSSANPTSKRARTQPAARLDAQARLLLLNALPTSSPQYADLAVPAVALLLRRLAATPSSPGAADTLLAPLMALYGIPALLPAAGDDDDTTTDFLVQVARKRGRLGKGGVPNLHAAAVAVLADWREGRVRGWVEAPSLQQQAGAEEEEEEMQVDREGGAVFVNGDRKEIVQGWAKEFRIEGLWGDGEEEAEAEQMVE